MSPPGHVRRQRKETDQWLVVDVHYVQIPATNLHFPRTLKLAREEPRRSSQIRVHVLQLPIATGLDVQRQYGDAALRWQGPRIHIHYIFLLPPSRGAHSTPCSCAAHPEVCTHEGQSHLIVSLQRTVTVGLTLQEYQGRHLFALLVGTVSGH